MNWKNLYIFTVSWGQYNIIKISSSLLVGVPCVNCVASLAFIWSPCRWMKAKSRAVKVQLLFLRLGVKQKRTKKKGGGYRFRLGLEWDATDKSMLILIC